MNAADLTIQPHHDAEFGQSAERAAHLAGLGDLLALWQVEPPQLLAGHEPLTLQRFQQSEVTVAQPGTYPDGAATPAHEEPPNEQKCRRRLPAARAGLRHADL